MRPSQLLCGICGVLEEISFNAAILACLDAFDCMAFLCAQLQCGHLSVRVGCARATMGDIFMCSASVQPSLRAWRVWLSRCIGTYH
eukprot:8270429-Karenia_brevis.AAC.1